MDYFRFGGFITKKESKILLLVPPRVLVVEENSDILDVLKRGLQIAGFDISAFSNPQDAIEHLKSHAHQQDLLLSDIRIPGLDGIELASRVKTFNPDIKVLFLTGSDVSDDEFDNEIVPMIKVTNTNSYNGKIKRSAVVIQKPARLETIIARVRETLSQYSSIATPADQEHIVILYPDELNTQKKSRYEDVVAEYLNTGLAKGQLCIYTYIEKDADTAMAALSNKISDYDKNVSEGNLMLVDFKPFCSSAQINDSQPFKELMKLANEKIADRSDKHVRIVGRAAGWLYENKYYNQCLAIRTLVAYKALYGILGMSFQNVLV